MLGYLKISVWGLQGPRKEPKVHKNLAKVTPRATNTPPGASKMTPWGGKTNSNTKKTKNAKEQASEPICQQSKQPKPSFDAQPLKRHGGGVARRAVGVETHAVAGSLWDRTLRPQNLMHAKCHLLLRTAQHKRQSVQGTMFGDRHSCLSHKA